MFITFSGGGRPSVRPADQAQTTVLGAEYLEKSGAKQCDARMGRKIAGIGDLKGQDQKTKLSEPLLGVSGHRVEPKYLLIHYSTH